VKQHPTQDVHLVDNMYLKEALEAQAAIKTQALKDPQCRLEQKLIFGCRSLI
jgi:hypothetical protein